MPEKTATHLNYSRECSKILNTRRYLSRWTCSRFGEHGKCGSRMKKVWPAPRYAVFLACYADSSGSRSDSLVSGGIVVKKPLFVIYVWIRKGRGA
ncbi:hypothetical protein KC19_12G051200 [Ceratodon purpureus]|uniref:Uncharacterized protein n=1 Tax=Ceratodon purpureus TaxID=3225 RepID=A0A8T0G668_CERPU|nr:hypothetical protein KC19_12G051200 [Ceratodon purpureus]